MAGAPRGEEGGEPGRTRSPCGAEGAVQAALRVPPVRGRSPATCGRPTRGRMLAAIEDAHGRPRVG